jgi:putative transcriptional regulator
MTKKKTKFRSPIAEAMHETVRGMHRVGLIDKKTMRDFDVRCLTLIEDLTAEDIVAMRQQAGVSQAVFARVLNVTTDYVSKLERGDKKPSGATLKLLSLMRRNGFEAIV